MNDCTIAIDGTSDSECRVSIQGPNGNNEVWNVSRDLEEFLAKLNGIEVPQYEHEQPLDDSKFLGSALRWVKPLKPLNRSGYGTVVSALTRL
jgi:hypothetical protein